MPKPGTPPSTGALKQPCMAPWQRPRHAAEGAANVGADGSGAGAALVPPAATTGGAVGAVVAEGATVATGAGAVASEAGFFGLAAAASSSIGRFLGELAASSRGGAGVADAGGSGDGNGRESCSILSRDLQAAVGAKTEQPSRNQAHTRLSMVQAKSQLCTRVKRGGRVSATLLRLPCCSLAPTSPAPHNPRATRPNRCSKNALVRRKF